MPTNFVRAFALALLCLCRALAGAVLPEVPTGKTGAASRKVQGSAGTFNLPLAPLAASEDIDSAPYWCGGFGGRCTGKTGIACSFGGDSDFAAERISSCCCGETSGVVNSSRTTAESLAIGIFEV